MNEHIIAKRNAQSQQSTMNHEKMNKARMMRAQTQYFNYDKGSQNDKLGGRHAQGASNLKNRDLLGSRGSNLHARDIIEEFDESQEDIHEDPTQRISQQKEAKNKIKSSMRFNRTYKMMKHQQVEQSSEFDSDEQALNETERNEPNADCMES